MGNHRARLRLPSQRRSVASGTVWAHVEWRLPGIEVEPRQLQLRDGATDRLVSNLHVASISSEAGRHIFVKRRKSGS